MESLASFAGLLQTDEEIKERYPLKFRPYTFIFFIEGGGQICNSTLRNLYLAKITIISFNSLYPIPYPMTT